MDYNKLALEMHEQNKGKIAVRSKVTVKTRDDLSTAYTPGVAEPCRKIRDNKEEVYRYTAKGNLVAVVSDGTAVLGLGDIGPEAAMPVMEGKALLFKEFADVDAFPIVLDTKNVDEIVETIVRISPSLGGINLEDISAPRCFEIERKLKERLDIPVFHDDQHGTAVVVLSGIINALKVVKKNLTDLKVVINGAGSAGSAICKLLLSSGVKNIVMCDINGVIHEGGILPNDNLKELAKITNPNKETGLLKDAIKNADVFIGVSAPNIVSKEMVASMNKDAILFAMANPTPEIFPEDALEAGAKVVGTGRSDYPNQINNVLAFPGIFRGALDVRASEINEEMKVAAAYAIANSISEDEITAENIIPKAFDLKVQKAVAEAVKAAAIKTGVNKI